MKSRAERLAEEAEKLALERAQRKKRWAIQKKRAAALRRERRKELKGEDGWPMELRAALSTSHLARTEHQVALWREYKAIPAMRQNMIEATERAVEEVYERALREKAALMVRIMGEGLVSHPDMRSPDEQEAIDTYRRVPADKRLSDRVETMILALRDY